MMVIIKVLPAVFVQTSAHNTDKVARNKTLIIINKN